MPASNPVVSNTTPLITLGEVGLMHLLRDLYDEIKIPRAVSDEYQRGMVAHPQRPSLADLPWITVRVAPDDPAISDTLDQGEREAIALARLQQARLILLDERQARAEAMRLQLTVTGTIGVLIESKRQGKVPALKPVLELMVAQGRRLHPRLIQQALELAGE